MYDKGHNGIWYHDNLNLTGKFSGQRAQVDYHSGSKVMRLRFIQLSTQLAVNQNVNEFWRDEHDISK
jgi:hypothetical protein